ncbi:aldehyde dehydrogenase family protein [Pseudalkalibacillus caeni]|uniref:Aldehyde dehydrogenase family protein n=1 Tax=Exobacillus caeni TaxID=2574798 RepID=A0A5R9F524_9BACL|nr:aldehyde dehydrogenase family protein [Pseudalkalibacillus caeni]TLS36748.1 aldehyde dehydrogenase family protein [Pseudalkalibacillus caeni]
MLKLDQINKSFINGEWTEGTSGRTGDILNPFDDSVITTVKLATKDQLKEAFESARHAQKEWAKTTTEERKSYLQKAVDYIKENKDDVKDLVIHESGGTHVKADVEINLTIGLLEEAINYAHELHDVRNVEDTIEGKVNHVHRLPLGVISSISPFNFPMNLSMRTIAPAIALGNTVVHKPDLQTGLTGGSIFAKAFEEANLPKGVFNMILTDLEEIGDEMLTNPIPRLIGFTGSTKVGKKIGEIAGGSLKRVALELGGNNPFVVLSDADVDQAVDAAIFGKFIHQGQICMIINRLIIHKDLYEEFKQKFVERAKELPYGDPADPQTVVGPLINKEQLNKALGIVERAKQNGTNVALEGEAKGNVLSPYVFSEVDNSSELAQTELFAPIATLIKAESDEEAIEMANDTQYGLSSAIFTTNLDRGEELALQIDSGMTHVNDQTVNDSPIAPFGGNKESGMGRFGYPWVIDEFTVTKWVSLQTKYRKFPF